MPLNCACFKSCLIHGFKYYNLHEATCCRKSKASSVIFFVRVTRSAACDIVFANWFRKCIYKYLLLLLFFYFCLLDRTIVRLVRYERLFQITIYNIRVEYEYSFIIRTLYQNDQALRVVTVSCVFVLRLLFGENSEKKIFTECTGKKKMITDVLISVLQLVNAIKVWPKIDNRKKIVC